MARIGTDQYSVAGMLVSARAVLDTHLLNARGVCIECGATGRCPRRETAIKIFFRYNPQG